MHKAKVCAAAFVLAGLLGVSIARAEKAPELICLTFPLSVGPDVVGELVTETPTAITLIEIKSGKQRVFEKSGVTKIKRDISDADAVAGSDLPSMLAWKINKLSEATPAVTRIAKITDSAIYLTAGTKDGLTVGQKLNVFRSAGDIVDPVTKKVIAQERPRIAQVTVTEVQDAYSKAKRVGDLETALAVGDEIETIPLKVSVAITPLVDADGKETEAGTLVSEELTNSLVGRKVQVVERNLIRNVFKEMLIQTSELVDPTTVQRLGKQIGASTVLTGKIVPAGNQSKIFVRLISVETGQVLLTGSQTVNPKTGSSIGSAGSGTAGDTAATGKTSTGTSGTTATAGGLITLGSKNMPDYLTTKDAVNSTKDGMDLKGNKFLHTKDRNLFKGDFTLDVVCVRSTGDGILLCGIGELADAGGEPPSPIRLRFHAPDLAEGYIGFNVPGKKEETIGKIRTAGTHLIRIEKQGKALTIAVYANYEGKLPDAPDFSKTIPDLTETAPAIVKSGCVYFGDAVYSKVSLTRSNP